MFRGISTEPDIVELDENLNAIEHHYLGEEEEIKKVELPRCWFGMTTNMDMQGECLIYEVLAKRADTTLTIRVVASFLGLNFVPLRWERYDLLISKDRFFEPGVQFFLGLLHEPRFREIARGLEGYDLDLCGKMVFPQKSKENT